MRRRQRTLFVVCRGTVDRPHVTATHDRGRPAYSPVGGPTPLVYADVDEESVYSQRRADRTSSAITTEESCNYPVATRVKAQIALRPRGFAVSLLMRRHWKLTLFSVALIVATAGWLWLLLKAAQHFLAR